MTVSGQHKLADNGVTTPELRELCEKILEDYGVPMIAVELVSVLKSDYGRDVSHSRLANILSDDNNIQKGLFESIPRRTFKTFNEKNNLGYYKKLWYWF